MTILEDLKAGRLVVVPREMTAEMVTAYRLARMNTEGGYGGPGPWEAALTASPSHTAGLIALVEGMERERDEAWADWSALPKDLYVTEVRTGDGIVFDVALCSVPMAIGPEVRYSRAETPRCEHCDGTGDAHSIDGEWRGYCACPAGVALTAEAERDALREALEPFARAAEDCGVLDDLRDGKVKPADIIWEGAVAAAITYGDVARALTQEQNNGNG